MENNHRDRPPKKSYDPNILMQELISTVTEAYDTTHEIKATAVELFLPPNKVKKLLSIIAFQEYPFYTSSGLSFSYTLKMGRNGAYTKELFIDRRENSKSLACSSIWLAFQNVETGKVCQRPKAIGDIRGISYSYSLFWRFGVIRVPEI